MKHTMKTDLSLYHSHLAPRSSSLAPRPGMILLVVIVIIALLSLAGYAFMALMNTELDSARQRGHDIQVQFISQSGVSLLESVAMLSQNERQWAGGTFDNPTLFCAASIDSDMFRSEFSPRFTVVAPKLDNGRMTGIRYGLINESSKLHLAKVLEWETANPGDGVNALTKLPGMTVQLAESMLDWIDADDQQRPGGAESAWYAQQRLPYKPRNAVPVTLDEFLLVRGVTRQLMFGDDENFNFVPDAQEARMSGYAQNPRQTTPTQAAMPTGNATPGIPWGHLLTVVSAERDANPSGVARIDLNDANLEFLHSQLVQRVGREVADFVILYRQYGTEELVNQGAEDRAQGRNARQASPVSFDDVPNIASVDIASDLAPLSLEIGNGLSGMSLTGQLPDGDATPSQPGVEMTASDVPPPLAIPDNVGRATRGSSQGSGGRGQGTGSRGQGAGRFGARTARDSRFAQYVDLQTPAQYRLETPLDIVGIIVVIPPPQPDVPPDDPTAATMPPPQPIQLDSPLAINTSTLNSTLLTYLDETSTSPGTTIIGRINLNEAPYEVIAGIPGLSQNAARSIVTRREQQANGIRELYRQPTWLLAYNIVDLATLKKIWPHVTCGGDVFRGQVISFYEDIGTFSRVDVAVDATVFPPRLVDFKDLTSHGIGFHDRVLFGNIPRQGQVGGIAGSTAPTMADFGGGSSLSDMSGGYSNIAPLVLPQ